MLKSILEYARDYGDKKWHQTTFQYIRYAVYIVTAIAFTGVVTIDPKYIYILETIIEVYVAIFLMLKFNPLVEHKRVYLHLIGRWHGQPEYSYSLHLS